MSGRCTPSTASGRLSFALAATMWIWPLYGEILYAECNSEVSWPTWSQRLIVGAQVLSRRKSCFRADSERLNATISTMNGLRLATSKCTRRAAVFSLPSRAWGTRSIHRRRPLPYSIEEGLGNFLPPQALKVVAEDYQEGLLERLNEQIASE